jgi:hypothetical protein
MSATVPGTGAQNERTALAWQRTALSLMVASAILARLTYARLGVLAAVASALAFGVSAWVFWESRGRYRHDAGLRARPRPRGGRAGAALACAVSLIAATELAAMLAGDRG